MTTIALTRRVGEAVVIDDLTDDPIEVTVVNIGPDRVSILVEDRLTRRHTLDLNQQIAIRPGMTVALIAIARVLSPNAKATLRFDAPPAAQVRRKELRAIL